VTWLRGRSPHTQLSMPIARSAQHPYRADAARFWAFVSKPPQTLPLGDVQA
jgi:hypothetical protein